ncbi:MAG: hypothetical protein AAFR88_08935 [Pseudomonadota bacterium]
MKILEHTKSRITLSLTPWDQWIMPSVIGALFVAAAIFQPFEFPLWAWAVMLGLGILAPLAFLSSHAAVRAEFSRAKGRVTITRMKPLGGTSTETIALADIIGVEEVIETDTDNTDWHKIELIVQNKGFGARSNPTKRVALTTGPVSTDMAPAARKLGRWLDVPVTA